MACRQIRQIRNDSANGFGGGVANLRHIRYNKYFEDGFETGTNEKVNITRWMFCQIF